MVQLTHGHGLAQLVLSHGHVCQLDSGPPLLACGQLWSGDNDWSPCILLVATCHQCKAGDNALSPLIITSVVLFGV